tara:strand:+ start:1055 stop:2674 length:1620 start_codon:yes stop_codon:yes gene_type:complete
VVTLEQVLDLIAEKLIVSVAGNDPDIIRKNQKVIRNGILSYGANRNDSIVLYDRDVKANLEDYRLGTYTDLSGESPVAMQGTLESIISSYDEETTINQIDVVVSGDTTNLTVAITGPVNANTTTYDITTLLTQVSADGTVINPLNVSQFINVEQLIEEVDPERADEVFQRDIYELLGRDTTRQKRINAFFEEFEALTNPPPNFQIQDGYVGENFSSNDYHWNNDITAPQEYDEQSTIIESQGMITRRDFDANTENSGRTLESLRDTLNTYLIDVDQSPPEPDDQRPVYQNQSDGYLKFRNLNQGIIVRNTNSEFIEGLNPDTQDYLETGFTITMWVRFLDKTSEGTLFNFGNPLRNDGTAFGFKLETYILNREDEITHASFNNFGEYVDDSDYFANTLGIFSDTNSERFVRLAVNDNGTLRDSHLGNGIDKLNSTLGDIPDLEPYQDGYTSDEYRLLTTTKIPQNFGEWYFICATFNPDVDEDNSFDSITGLDYDSNPDFWRGNINLDGTYTHYSGYGNRCKVEIISRSDLLRARGYKV